MKPVGVQFHQSGGNRQFRKAHLRDPHRPICYPDLNQANMITCSLHALPASVPRLVEFSLHNCAARRPGKWVALVRRAKALILSGCDSRPATVAPAGSNRSGSGGNNTAEAFDGKSSINGNSASRQAVARVNAEQAPKTMMWEPTQPMHGEGRCHRFPGSDPNPPVVPPG
jgi:hypothetical protein